MRRTKIIATLGPATDSTEMLGKLVDAGMNVARLNMSHAPLDWVSRVVRELRDAASARRRHDVAKTLERASPQAPAPTWRTRCSGFRAGRSPGSGRGN